MTIDTLTSYELFQLERYGNILVNGKPTTIEELENGSQEIDDFEERVNNHFELELLSHD